MAAAPREPAEVPWRRPRPTRLPRHVLVYWTEPPSEWGTATRGYKACIGPRHALVSRAHGGVFLVNISSMAPRHGVSGRLWAADSRLFPRGPTSYLAGSLGQRILVDGPLSPQQRLDAHLAELRGAPISPCEKRTEGCLRPRRARPPRFDVVPGHRPRPDSPDRNSVPEPSRASVFSNGVRHAPAKIRRGLLSPLGRGLPPQRPLNRPPNAAVPRGIRPMDALRRG